MLHNSRSTAHRKREIRVFVSSTFRDMHEEREELVKWIFPQIRKLCESRGVVWGEVDLRWGISDENKAEGQVLPICLAEIHNCRPFFIGLLGERYGWTPRQFTNSLLAREPWLGKYRDRSVTELEIIHGVLHKPEMADYAFFYFRDPAYIETQPAKCRPHFIEEPTPQDIARLGVDEAYRLTKGRQRQLVDLKTRIRKSQCPVRENYPDPKTLGQLVLKDLTKVIDQEYPEESPPNKLDRDAAFHEAFAESRARVYVEKPDYFDHLDAHVQSSELPLVVLGESGVGKSALLANWVRHFRSQNPKEIVLIHFIGASRDSTYCGAMLRRLMGEFQRRYEIQVEIPDKPNALRLAFGNCLNSLGRKRRMVLILDGLNQLEDRDGGLDLVWLPPKIPDNVRLFLTTLPGPSLDELDKRGWPTLRVTPLKKKERAKLIVSYLAQYTKVLNTHHVERIISSPQSSNPLYLRTLLEELRIFGQHEKLEQRINQYLDAQSAPQLFQKIFERYEEDYEQERQGLVREALSYLWAARRGLSESELLEMLGTDVEPLAHAHWSPLRLAMEQDLINRGGLMGFSHEYLRKAIEARYVPKHTEQKAAHLRVAHYFERRGMGVRKVEELPWQLVEAQAWPELNTLLADPHFFQTAWDTDQYGVKGYWAKIEGASPLRIVDAYRPILKAPDQFQEHILAIGALLYDTGHLDEAASLLEHLVTHFKRTKNKVKLATVLRNQANIVADRGDLKDALALYRKGEQLCRKLSDKAGLAKTLGCQASILRRKGDMDTALRLYQEEAQLYRELQDKAGAAHTSDSQAKIFATRGDLKKALRLYQEAEQLYREVGEKTGLAHNLTQQGDIVTDRGDFDKALALFREGEKLFRDLGDKAGLASNLGNQAGLFFAKDNLKKAQELYDQEEKLFWELRDKAGVAHGLTAQADLLVARGDLDKKAIGILGEAEKLYREMGEKAGLAATFNRKANLFAKAGDLMDRKMAKKLCQKAEQLYQELGDKEGIANSIENHANIIGLFSRGDHEKALMLYQKAEQLYRELGNKNGIARTLCEQADLFSEGLLDDPLDSNKELGLYKKAERLYRQLGDNKMVARTLCDQADNLLIYGEREKGLKLYRKAEQLYRELGNKTGLAHTLCEQADNIYEPYVSTDGLDEALRLNKEAEQLFSELGDQQGLRRVLGQQGELLFDGSDFKNTLQRELGYSEIENEIE